MDFSKFPSAISKPVAALKLGPALGSDHLPILMSFDESATPTSGRPLRWIFKEDKWDEWNAQIADRLRKSNFTSYTTPEPAYSIFYDILMESSNGVFRKSSSAPRPRQEPRKPWWDKTCNAAVHTARKAYREWRDSPLSIEKRMIWQQAEAQKRKHIIQAKRNSWRSHLTKLDVREDPSKIWNFVKGMLGKKITSNPLDNAILKDQEGREYHSVQDKASLILDMFSRNFSTDIPNNEIYEPVISSSIASTTPNALNSAITLTEIDLSLKKLKNTSMGIDLVHNRMLMKLSPVNRSYLCHLFNIIFHHTYVPEKWKQAIIAPLLKSGKVAEDPISYRPVALTSCLGKCSV